MKSIGLLSIFITLNHLIFSSVVFASCIVSLVICQFIVVPYCPKIVLLTIIFYSLCLCYIKHFHYHCHCHYQCIHFMYITISAARIIFATCTSTVITCIIHAGHVDYSMHDIGYLLYKAIHVSKY